MSGWGRPWCNGSTFHSGCLCSLCSQWVPTGVFGMGAYEVQWVPVSLQCPCSVFTVGALLCNAVHCAVKAPGSSADKTVNTREEWAVGRSCSVCSAGSIAVQCWLKMVPCGRRNYPPGTQCANGKWLKGSGSGSTLLACATVGVQRSEPCAAVVLEHGSLHTFAIVFSA